MRWGLGCLSIISGRSLVDSGMTWTDGPAWEIGNILLSRYVRLVVKQDTGPCFAAKLHFFHTTATATALPSLREAAHRHGLMRIFQPHPRMFEVALNYAPQKYDWDRRPVARIVAQVWWNHSSVRLGARTS